MKVKSKTLDDLIKNYKNKKGDDEAESTIVANNGDKRHDGIVHVYAMGSDVSKIAYRCKNSIKKWSENGHGGVSFEIDVKAFRGVVYAFRSIK